MNKKILLPILGLTLTSVVAVGVVSHAVYATEPQVHTYIVDYFNNYQREEFTLSKPAFVPKKTLSVPPLFVKPAW